MATKGSGKGSTPMTPKASARIQSTTAKSTGGAVSKGSFAARSQSAAAKNTAPVKVTGQQTAQKAATVLKSPSTGASSKSAAGSALAQKPPAKKR